jgi:hypothetical protein
MTKEERKRLAYVIQSTECLFAENIALKLVLEHRKVENWEKLLDRLLADPEILAGVRLKFQDLYRELDSASDPSRALETALGEIPHRRKPH